MKLLILPLLIVLTPTLSLSHGGVVLEEDICLIKVGFYQAHFTIFQPETRQHEQFCEDLPDTGDAIFVLEYLHDGLDQMEVDFRIIKNITGNGKFANSEDIAKIADLEAITVFYQPPVKKPDVFAALHNFDESAEFIGIVKAQDPSTSKVYTAVFPFETGFTSGDFGDLATLSAIPVIILLWLIFKYFGKIKNKRKTSAFTLILALIALPHHSVAETREAEDRTQKEFTGTSQTFNVTASPNLAPIRINQIHSWELIVTNKTGEPVKGANIAITGGMPLHDHGLPTAPQITLESPPGHYLAEGVKFHMRGYWEIGLVITSGLIKENLSLGFNL